jgi:hypothetical protein
MIVLFILAILLSGHWGWALFFTLFAIFFSK